MAKFFLDYAGKSALPPRSAAKAGAATLSRAWQTNMLLIILDFQFAGRPARHAKIEGHKRHFAPEKFRK